MTLTEDQKRELTALREAVKEWKEARKDHGHCGEGTLEYKQRWDRLERAEARLLALVPKEDPPHG